MTTYFAAPDGHGDDTLWVHTGVPDLPQPVLRRVDLGIGMAHHWDELVARVIAGNERHRHDWKPAGVTATCACGVGQGA